MNRLFIDTSSDYLSILLLMSDVVVSNIKLVAGRKMSEILLTQIDNVFKLHKLTPNDIDEFYCIIGPGSFTGVRIGVSFILGISSGVSKSAYGITSIDAYAASKGSGSFSVAAVLKDDNYALRRYDFEKGQFSTVESVELTEDLKKDIFFVNSVGSETVDLESFVNKKNYIQFRQSCVPIYLRKAEAELSFDKKSNN